MENLLLRDAVLDDLHILKEFEQEIIKAERPFDATIRPDPVNYYDLEDYVMRDDVKVVVAEVNGELVASGYALKKKARHYLDHEYYGYLGFMFTKTEYRGKGINARITENLKDWCKKQGLTEVRLTVYQDNVAAVHAYKKCGFDSHLNEMRLRLKN